MDLTPSFKGTSQSGLDRNRKENDVLSQQAIRERVLQEQSDRQQREKQLLVDEDRHNKSLLKELDLMQMLIPSETASKNRIESKAAYDLTYRAAAHTTTTTTPHKKMTTTHRSKQHMKQAEQTPAINKMPVLPPPPSRLERNSSLMTQSAPAPKEQQFNLPADSDLEIVGRLGAYQVAQSNRHASLSSRTARPNFLFYVLTLIVALIYFKSLLKKN